MYAKILQRLLQNFFLTMGRAPGTPKEWSKLRRRAMELARKEEGIPSVTKNTTIQDLMTGPHISDGPKGQRMWDFSQKRGEVIPFPHKGLRGLMEKGDVQLGKAPKTTPEHLKAKKDRGILLRDADEDILRIKRENKEAIQRFKDKNPDKFQFGGIAPLIGEPSYAADFYDDRIPMAGGGALFKFIEKLFIKASNDIRQGKGKWKGLDQKQRIVQHDNLTKKVTEFQKTGKLPEGTEQYFDVNVDEAFAAAQAKATRLGKRGPHWKEREVQGQMDEIAGGVDERTALKQKYPGISDDLLEKILVDDNPQRKADVIGTIDDYMKLREVGKSEAEAYDIITRSFSKNPTKHAAGGRIGFNPGGPVDHDALVQMYIAEGLSYEEAVQAAQASGNLPWDTLKKAEGGIIRAGFPFGGQALKAIRAAWRANKTWGVGGPPYKPEATSFNVREMTKRTLGEELSLKELKKLSGSPVRPINAPKFEDFNRQFKNIKAQILKEKMMERKLEAKAMINAAERTMKDATKEFESAFGPLKNKKKQHEMAKSITDQMTRQSKESLKEVREGLKEIDIYMGMLQKKGRSVHAEGGRVSYSGGGRAGLPAVTMGTPLPEMQGPQMPAAPQPTGIPGANLQMNQMDLMQQKMQQNPWMQNNMRQGIGGMQNPQYKGQFRMPFGLGGMSRRAFMKLMAGAAALPFIGKGVSKVAPKAIKETTEVIARGADGMPTYITDLIEVVKAKGTKDIIEGFKRSDYSTVHRYKGVEVIDEPSGAIRIKQGKETPLYGSDEPGYHEIEMEIIPGEYIQKGSTVSDDAAKAVKGPDEYVEYTAKPDMDGKLKDVEEYIDDVDHLDLKEIADEIDTLVIKKASGGLARMLGE